MSIWKVIVPFWERLDLTSPSTPFPLTDINNEMALMILFYLFLMNSTILLLA